MGIRYQAESHVCTDVQMLESRRDLTGDKTGVRMANDKRVVATTVGVVYLSHLSGLLLKV